MPINIPVLTQQNNTTSLGIIFPFQETTTGGIFGVTRTTLQEYQSDLTAFLTAPKRAYVMNNDLYSPLVEFVFEQMDDISIANLQTALTQKINLFFPDLLLVATPTQQAVNLAPDYENNILVCTINYSIPSIGVTNQSTSVTIQMAS